MKNIIPVIEGYTYNERWGKITPVFGAKEITKEEYEEQIRDKALEAAQKS